MLARCPRCSAKSLKYTKRISSKRCDWVTHTSNSFEVVVRHFTLHAQSRIFLICFNRSIPPDIVCRELVIDADAQEVVGEARVELSGRREERRGRRGVRNGYHVSRYSLTVVCQMAEHTRSESTAQRIPRR